ncbi:hypothetical protein H2199_005422 [Coniosporium tulheliwenetii]|uniref:Uncharacterized protein n=1 Tax=Coniosporium tulheliwenetii TaxID=3383036 RepID=A0ACC2Z1E2_9PEZI|nr:hypothetical protein H2199_005422 [Cladosporium sp. JES 115]
MKLDPAVIKLLSLDPSNTSVSSHGGGGMSSASTSKITTKLSDGTGKSFFMKTGKGKDAEIMFRGEHASLNAIHAAVPSLCPQSFGWGHSSSSSSTFFLVTDFLHLSPRHSTSISSQSTNPPSLAAKLAQLHTTPAPIPEGHDRPMFGFPVPTCCGDTPQDNTFSASWADFYANSRLRFILSRCEAANGADGELRRLVEATAGGVKSVVVHGDLWSGNASRGCIGAETEVQDVVYDPSSCYAHSEYELGIMKMFGGLGELFEGISRAVSEE